jgi:hypothetical protein
MIMPRPSTEHIPKKKELKKSTINKGMKPEEIIIKK